LIKICPQCKGLAHYNSHFKAFICLSPECTWMEEVYHQKNSNQHRILKVANKKSINLATAANNK